jgi:hypothetical protein
MQVKKIDIVKQMLMLNWKFGECFDWGDCVMIGQAISEHFNEGVELKAEPERYRGRSGARKIRKIIKRCKADTEAIKRLDDEQKEFLERLRKHL